MYVTALVNNNQYFGKLRITPNQWHYLLSCKDEPRVVLEYSVQPYRALAAKGLVNIKEVTRAEKKKGLCPMATISESGRDFVKQVEEQSQQKELQQLAANDEKPSEQGTLF